MGARRSARLLSATTRRSASAAAAAAGAAAEPPSAAAGMELGAAQGGGCSTGSQFELGALLGAGQERWTPLSSPPGSVTESFNEPLCPFEPLFDGLLDLSKLKEGTAGKPGSPWVATSAARNSLASRFSQATKDSLAWPLAWQLSPASAADGLAGFSWGSARSAGLAGARPLEEPSTEEGKAEAPPGGSGALLLPATPHRLATGRARAHDAKSEELHATALVSTAAAVLTVEAAARVVAGLDASAAAPAAAPPSPPASPASPASPVRGARTRRARAGADRSGSAMGHLVAAASEELELHRMGQDRRRRELLARTSGGPSRAPVDALREVPLTRARLAQSSAVPPAGAASASAAIDDGADRAPATKRLKVAPAPDRANQENEPRYSNVPT
jgi:hypothetical protein